ncbi:MAG: hypothetical protein WC900_04170 [Oscillospiraceae bacterium]|jgi:hypothetical protein
MANFNIDPDIIADSILQALEDSQAEMAEDVFNQVIDKIEETLPGVIPLLAQRTQEMWRAEARGTSHGWGEKYANAIKAKVSGDSAEVYVDESMTDKSTNKPSIMFTEMIEKGVKSWSIKEALLKSEKAKVSADGIKYIIVPFPVSTPRKQGSGQQMSRFGGREMTQDAYALVKGGGRFSGQLKSGQEVSGLTRYTDRQKHEGYGLFLCVSQKSSGWIFPGVGAEPVYNKVLQKVNEQIGQLIAGYCTAIVKEFS